MNRAVRLSLQAETDLESIGDRIAEHSPKRAALFVNEIRLSCEGLGQMADRFELVARYPGIRRRVHGNCLIFYRTSAEMVEIVHIMHGAMDYEDMLFPK